MMTAMESAHRVEPHHLRGTEASFGCVEMALHGQVLLEMEREWEERNREATGSMGSQSWVCD